MHKKSPMLSTLGLLLLLLLTLYLPRSVKADSNLCQLSVPAAPILNLSTPWELQAPCHEANSNQAVFVQAVIFDKDTGKLSTYAPLVVDAGSLPAIAPVPVTLPQHADVAVFGGGDDDATTLVGSGASSCVNGADGNVFGQVFFCGTSAFWSDVNAAHLRVPPIGVGKDGQPCPTVRSFKIVDQDQSDNVQSTYLSTASGQTAQNTAANRVKLGSFTVMKNGSDNRLLSDFVGPAIGCTTWSIPDLADNWSLVPTQATNELQAAAYQGEPIALVPAGDPMTGPNNLDMVNAYRAGVDQRQIKQLSQANTTAYCSNMRDIAPGFFATNQARFTASPSPDTGTNLYDFLQGRYGASLQLLHCH
jgi:hypothetical protein